MTKSASRGPIPRLGVTPGDKLGVWQDMRLADALVLLLVTAASDLLVHKILLNSVLLSPIVSGSVLPKPLGQTLLGHNPLVCWRSWVGWGQDPASWVG